MIHVLKAEERTDKHGKKYKYLYLYSPEHKVPILRKGVLKQITVSSKYCGYVAYRVNYAESQSCDPMYNLKEGDTTEGRIVSAKVQPYILDGQLQTRCKVPVFCTEDDPILFQIETEKAIKRAGKVLAHKSDIFGNMLVKQEEQELPTKFKIPKSCLIVKKLD